MSIQLHVEEDVKKQGTLFHRIEAAFAKGVHVISAKLPVSDIQVNVRFGKNVMPETGMAGFNPSANSVIITIDPDNPELDLNFDTEFIATMGHEMHHAMRRRGPGFGNTLGEVLITEGLASHFETELRQGAAPLYAMALDERDLEKSFARAKKEWHSTEFNYGAWFLGSADERLGRFTGYSLGYSIVNAFINAHSIPASGLWDMDAAKIHTGKEAKTNAAHPARLKPF